jgi:hypothetical protein
VFALAHARDWRLWPWREEPAEFGPLDFTDLLAAPERDTAAVYDKRHGGLSC